MFIILIILIFVLIAAIVLYNGLIKARIKTEESLSGIDVALAKRYSVLSNLQTVVKAAAAHEKEVLRTITAFRKDMTLLAKEQLNQEYDQQQAALLALAEAYPELKVSENFLNLQQAIFDCEEHLQAARRFHNANTALYNEKIQVFPTNMMAGLLNYQKKEYFMAEAAERENVVTDL